MMISNQQINKNSHSLLWINIMHTTLDFDITTYWFICN